MTLPVRRCSVDEHISSVNRMALWKGASERLYESVGNRAYSKLRSNVRSSSFVLYFMCTDNSHVPQSACNSSTLPSLHGTRPKEDGCAIVLTDLAFFTTLVSAAVTAVRSRGQWLMPTKWVQFQKWTNMAQVDLLSPWGWRSWGLVLSTATPLNCITVVYCTVRGERYSA